MSYGITAYSDSGRILFDSVRSGFTQVMSGTLYVSEQLTYSFRGEISIPSAYGSYGQYLVAYLPPSSVPISYWGNILYARSSSAISVPYRVFALVESVSPSSDSWGLRMWGQDGTLKFDSGLTTFNVLSSHTPRVGQDVSYNGEWIIAGSAGLRGLVNAGGYNGAFTACFLRNQGGYLESANAPYDAGPQTTTSQQCVAPYSVMRIDII